jgi:hypothetical protein
MKINQYVIGTTWRWLDMSRNIYLWFGLSNNMELCFIASFGIKVIWGWNFVISIDIRSTLWPSYDTSQSDAPSPALPRSEKCFNLFGRWEWHIPQKLITLYGVITQRIITRIQSAIKASYPTHQSPWNLYPELCIVRCIVFVYVPF